MSEARGWRFAFSKRWLGYLALLIVFAIACGMLSRWQFDRRAEKVAENHRIEANFDRAAVPIVSVLPELGSWSTELEWAPVELRGHYLAEEQLLARARPMNGFPGFEILTPFETSDGRIFIVDRGWVPTGNTQDSPDHVPAPPPGEVTVTARLKPGEPEIPGRSAPAGQIATIHLPTFAKHLGGDRVYQGAYGLLATETPAGDHGELVPRPQLTEGNHLSYAVQWILFAVIAAVGLVLGIRNEYRYRNPDDPKVQAARAREIARKAKRAKTDGEIEDEILDRLA